MLTAVLDVELPLLEQRLGRLHARQRLGVERDHESQVFGQGLNFFHIENSAFTAFAIEFTLKITGLFFGEAGGTLSVSRCGTTMWRRPNCPPLSTGLRSCS